MPSIHPSAQIDPAAELADDVEVGAFAVVEGPAQLGPGVRLLPAAQVLGDCVIGARTVVGRGAVIGDLPQSINFDPETPSGVRVGEDNVFRENVTIHRSANEGCHTVLGDSNFLMVNAHLGHDVQMGDHNIMANNSGFGGHCLIEDFCFVGGGALVHQFIRMGRYCMVKGNASISQDAPPFCTVAETNGVFGLNVVGLRRGGFTPAERKEIKAAYKAVFHGASRLTHNLKGALDRPEPWGSAASHFLGFLSQSGPRASATPAANEPDQHPPPPPDP